MPKYDIECDTCGVSEVIRRMNAYEKNPDPKTGKLVTYRKCGCGELARVLYITAPGGIVDEPAGSKRFKVYGIEGTFKSHKDLERHCRANDLDLSRTSDASWKKTKHKSREAAEGLATEMGYRNLADYKTSMKDPSVAEQKVNETKERQGTARD